jgi:perosamine synthetase
VVEDAAEAHLARYKGRPTGGLAPLATFSFYGNKIFTCGEGGALALSDPQLELRIRTLRGQGMDPQRRYYFPVTGYNFRMTNVQAAMLCAQLERQDTILGQRKAIFAAYKECLNSISGIGFQPCASWAEPAAWLFSIVIDEKAYGRTRDELAHLLAADGIETRPFFVPLHQLPPFRGQSRARQEHLPETDYLAERGLNLPTYNSLSLDDVGYIADRIRLHGQRKHD